MPRFRKRPIEIEAVKFDGSTTCMIAIHAWMSGAPYARSAVATRDLRTMEINTLEGVMTANPGDWILKGVVGEFYPCRDDVFQATHEPIEESDGE